MSEFWKQNQKPVVSKSPEEWAAEAAGVDGWACPACGCKDFRVVDSRFTANDPRFTGFAKRRMRVCRNCKRPLPSGAGTLEIAIPEGCQITLSPITKNENTGNAN